MAKTKGGLTKWFKQDWVDIGAPKKGGGFAKCGRTKQKKDAKRKYPKCVPRAKANAMTKSQIKSAVKRKRANPMKKVKTIVRKIKKPYARKIQILTVGEQRAKVMNKKEVASIFKKAKETLKKQHDSKTKNA